MASGWAQVGITNLENPHLEAGYSHYSKCLWKFINRIGGEVGLLKFPVRLNVASGWAQVGVTNVENPHL